MAPTVSLWLSEPHVPRPPAQGDLSAKVAVVGGGMTGASLAWFLRELGREVVLLESGVLAGGASGRNAGFVITGLGEHYANSIRTYGESDAREIWRINHANVDLVEQVVRDAKLADACGYARRGGLTIARSPQEWDVLQESARLQNRDGFGGTLVPADDLNERLQSVGFAGGILQPRDGEINSARFVRGLARAAESHGVRVFESSPVRAIVREGGRWRLALPGATVGAEHVVVAANAWARSLSPYLAAHTFPVRAQVLATDVLRHPGFDLPVYCDYGYEYWRGYEGRAIVGGERPADRAAEYTDEDALNPKVQAGLLSFLSEHFPTARPVVTHRWSGIMCFSEDGLPIVGALPEGPNLWCAAGFTGHGFGYAQVSARWIAEAILRGKDGIAPILRVGRVFDGRKRPQ